MIISVRSLLVPSAALVTAGAVALGPALVAPPAATVALPAVPIPAVHIADVQLAGIGQDIYYSIQPWVAYGVRWPSTRCPGFRRCPRRSASCTSMASNRSLRPR